MLELATRLLARIDAGSTLAVATAVRVEGSSPRGVGTSMAWDGERVIGSIAGGCVEGAVVELAQEVLADARARTAEFGISDETAFAVGLSCGGTIGIRIALLRPTDPVVAQLREASAGRPARVVVADDGFRVDECPGGLVERFVPPARMILIGGMEFSTALSQAARFLGFEVTVCDARPVFLTPERFPGATVVRRWPPTYLSETGLDDRTVVCVLSHDDRFDAQALLVALRSPAAYVGAMGSRRTHARRDHALRALGATPDELARLHSPIGLDLGAVTPEETAMSILAEIVAERSGRSAAPLRSTAGSLHVREPVG